MTYDFKGKTAVVTGASRGIGEAMARSADKLKALAASLPNGAVAIEADMGSADGWRKAADGALAALGEIDVLVNNAGVSAAQAMGKSLNQVVREFLEQLAGQRSVEAEIEEFVALSGRGDSGGARFERESTYAERVDRWAPKDASRRGA